MTGFALDLAQTGIEARAGGDVAHVGFDDRRMFALDIRSDTLGRPGGTRRVRIGQLQCAPIHFAVGRVAFGNPYASIHSEPFVDFFENDRMTETGARFERAPEIHTIQMPENQIPL
ncbi:MULTISPECIES: hypothetical protein [Ralstonia solanacearum species complex]|uniref:hypothetical protein n=1 Tax=Ralstonia solanacearum species complex TaxID=3116862 RepID=UPI0012D2D248|nr:hypothetical protein [Ralstonia solanacearum]MDN4065054.1 hypothetical protein [Ralstonia solanacearum]NUU72525.1 hypothetical protein [Ralstonia solanacearum]QHB55989.1 hypothetical protein GRB31_13415 [Ralstonia solanacearum]QHB60131.1 hypothetical protein GRD98_14295 [Ralstonia solanacearum]